jgi:hypothetical protein
MPTASGRSETVQELTPEQLLELNPDMKTPFAALHRISTELLPLALAGLAAGTRSWARVEGLVAGEDDGLCLSEKGQAVAAAAAAMVPEPYADVSLEELSEQTRRRIAELRHRTGDQALETPKRQPVEQPSTLVLRLREVGHGLGQRMRRSHDETHAGSR